MNNVQFIDFKSNGNTTSGILTAYEQNTGMPFDIKRVYTVTSAANNTERGFHAHKELEQIFIALQGEISVYCEDMDGNKEYYNLNSAQKTLYCGPSVWHTLKYSENAILLVLASDKYDEDDYIRNYDDFVKLSKKV